MATPPPSPMLDLRDADTVMGWIDGVAIGFRGFGDEAEAVHAAWVAYRKMSRHFAREGGHRLLPIDSEPMSLSGDGDAELILAGGRPIATLVRPGADSRSGPESFGFELQVPMPADELRMRYTAYLIYGTLRRSGIRWAMWAPAPHVSPADVSPMNVSPATTSPAGGEPRTDDRTPAAKSLTRMLSRHGADGAAVATLRDDATGVLGTVLIVVAMLGVVILPTITTSIVLPLLGGAAALIALAALASLVHLVATDVRDSWRGRRRATHGSPSGDGRLPAAARVAA